MEQSSCGTLQRRGFLLAVLLLLVASESSPAFASTKIRLGASTNFLDRVHEEDLIPELAWRQALLRMLGRFGFKWSGSWQNAESHLGLEHPSHHKANVVRIHNDAMAAQGAVLRQMAEERRIAQLVKGSVADKRGATPNSSGLRSSTGGRRCGVMCKVSATSMICLT